LVASKVQIRLFQNIKDLAVWQVKLKVGVDKKAHLSRCL